MASEIRRRFFIFRHRCRVCSPPPPLHQAIATWLRWCGTCWSNWRRYNSKHQKRNWRRAPLTSFRVRVWWNAVGPPRSHWLHPLNKDHWRQQGNRHALGVFKQAAATLGEATTDATD